MTNNTTSYPNLFNQGSKVANLLISLSKYDSVEFYILFFSDGVEVDRLHIHNANSQHVYYDIFGNRLVFGNDVKLSLTDITRHEIFIKGNSNRFRIYYTEDGIAKEISFIAV